MYMSRRGKKDKFGSGKWFIVQVVGFVILMLLCALMLISIENAKLSKQYESSMDRIAVIEETLLQLNSEFEIEE